MILFTVLLTLGGLYLPELSQSTNADSIAKVEISYLYWDTETFAPVQCSELLTSIRNLHGHFTIDFEPNFFWRLEYRLHNLKPTNSSTAPDARIVAKVFRHSGKVDTICVGCNRAMVYNNRRVKYDRNLERLFRALVPEDYGRSNDEEREYTRQAEHVPK